MARGGNLDWESQMKVVVVVVRERDFHFHPGLTSCFVVTSSLHSSSSRRSNFGAVRRTAGTPRFHRLDRTVWENVFFFSLWRMLILTCAEILVGLHLSPIYSSSLSLWRTTLKATWLEWPTGHWRSSPTKTFSLIPSCVWTHSRPLLFHFRNKVQSLSLSADPVSNEMMNSTCRLAISKDDPIRVADWLLDNRPYCLLI